MSAVGVFLLAGVGAQGCTIKSGDPTPTCGDGKTDGGEKCDDGAANGTSGHCRTDCQGPYYKYATLGDFCAAVGDGECNSSVTMACGSDGPSCTKAATAACSAISLPYHPEKAEACLSALTSAWSDASLSKDEVTSTGKACLPVFNKAGGNQAACTADSDCDALNGLSCIVRLSMTGATGHCAVPVMVAPGDSCSAADAQCDETHYCDGKHCVSVETMGASCSATDPCDASLRCEGATATVCTPRGMPGDTCTIDDDCDGFCLIASGTKTGKCKTTDTLNSLGTNCAPFGG